MTRPCNRISAMLSRHPLFDRVVVALASLDDFVILTLCLSPLFNVLVKSNLTSEPLADLESAGCHCLGWFWLFVESLIRPGGSILISINIEGDLFVDYFLLIPPRKNRVFIDDYTSDQFRVFEVLQPVAEFPIGSVSEKYALCCMGCRLGPFLPRDESLGFAS
mgnify:CR=1 FL=1